MTEAIAEQLAVARAALERFHDVTVDEDGALTFAHGGVVCALQGLDIEEGLPVLNLTCVVAWDLPLDSDVPRQVALGVGEGLFGTPRVIRGRAGWDVTWRYAFPAAGLDEKAMGTLLMLVVSGASSLRAALIAEK
ncbi:MAG TPA: hypothetical protein VKZ81_10290 [Pseudonocardia sp.]|uniref:hypothetical protein n=1 Tax=Pseudonocardia sp. TaxID=60912 RepID=UPI002B4B107E|nr:hypothetical protein [Pseudonocardia sp.]HLU55840.1 hypothetical protein [Pseudonocardia sp.]